MSKEAKTSEIAVDHVRLHQTVEILGAGLIGPSLNAVTIPTIKMKLTPMGLLVEMKNKAGKPCKPTIIPTPNIAAMQLAATE